MTPKNKNPINRVKEADYHKSLPKEKIPFIKKNYRLIIGALVMVLVVLLFSAFTFFNAEKRLARKWKKLDINCTNPEKFESAQKFAFHITIISINGINEKLPEDIGHLSHCRAEIFTKDNSGNVYVQSEDSTKLFTLNDLFNIWGVDALREGARVRVRVNNKPTNDYVDLVLRDGSNILLEYQVSLGRN